MTKIQTDVTIREEYRNTDIQYQGTCDNFIKGGYAHKKISVLFVRLEVDYEFFQPGVVELEGLIEWC